MKISLLQVGKTRNKSFAEVEEEYVKRIGPYAGMEVVSIKEASHGAALNAAEIEQVKRKEADEILKKIEGEGSQKTKRTGLIIALDERGKQYTSPAFAEFILQNRDQGKNITFIIGGCYGLHSTILERADMNLSLSKFTFTHEMIRQILLEQLYRAFTIISGKQYHY